MRIQIVMGASVLALGACAQDLGPVPYTRTPLPVVTAQQAVTNTAVVSPVRYQDPLAGYTYRGPTGPRDWRTVNEEQSEGN
ncbi:hypothetical protein [Sulfitobacter guttiformis]|uniref:Lipoprotein n=1 Tax=Sulfitobacter guttiformis TaxID=74349 RepID=A0A420DH76_9RHOB|nr:hypothetical protein [Sulfitobacter guttiformis]RKE93578.1 hypothetical protein C8N30_2651 [Sulfitobacter guttiformis]